jgi:pimeloyl-ACP methyl ester carboxylesterase
MAPLLTTYDVLKAFWYQRFFLDPTAEDVVAADDFAFIERLWADWSPGLDAADALVPVKAALAARANLSAALSTYRTLADLSLQPPQFMNELMAMMAPITVPTMYLHGEHDGCVPGLDIAAVETALPPGSEVHLLGSAGHFVQYDQPGLVNELIAGFIAS